MDQKDRPSSKIVFQFVSANEGTVIDAIDLTGSEDVSQYDSPYKTKLFDVNLMVYIRVISVVQLITTLLIFLSWNRDPFLRKDHYNFIGILPTVTCFYTAFVVFVKKTLIQLEDLPLITLYAFTSAIVWSLIYLKCYVAIFFLGLHLLATYVFTTITASYLETGYCCFSLMEDKDEFKFFYWHRLFLPNMNKSMPQKFKLLVLSILSFTCAIAFYSNVGSVFTYDGKYYGGTSFLVTSVLSAPIGLFDVWYYLNFKEDEELDVRTTQLVSSFF
ncbi:unnamed protein product [Bursaphelenchus okinawaensis]|uniref:Uncharacterized protein n=1 Tax=Bursaphelenchus okinawaensis TaxID=465554 RepID=A0A811KSW6_9BILA|nr:unnamed protein product [Bursaphelenchus okinawaensis]CAG9110196.1 unnamed protein product [Bursaphelenchus okinawaensis]